LAQGFEITRKRTVQGTKTVEVAYGMTSLSAGRASAADLLGLLRDHWKIENELHFVRDVTLSQVLADLRNAVVQWLRGVPALSCPEALEHQQIHPNEARRLFGIPQSD
jgi:hypothetical protein